MLKLHGTDREIGDTKVGRCRLDSARNFRPSAAALETGALVCSCDQLCEMPAGGCSRNSDATGIDCILCRVRSQIPYRTLAVFDICRERIIATQTIEDTRSDKSRLGEQERPRISILISALPAAAVEP